MNYKKIETYFDFLRYDKGSVRNVNEYVYGSNSLNSREIFAQRKKYQLIHPDASMGDLEGKKLDEFFTYLGSEVAVGRAMPISFWTAGQAAYGRIDSNKNYIYPKEFYYKQVNNTNNSSESVFVLNFVADAFEDLMKYIKIEKKKFLAEDDFLSNDIQPVRGLQLLAPLHTNIVNAHYEAFKTMLIENSKLNSGVIDFESFLDHFLNTYGSLALKEYPLGRTGLLQSNKISPNASGLCLELSKEDHDKDQPKKEKYLNSPNYHFYTAAAAQFGFMVDKNAPWRLVANIYSPKMRPYIQKYFQNYSNEGWTTSNLDHSHYYMGYTNSLIEGAENPKQSIQTNEIKNFADDTPVAQHSHVITKDGEVSIEIALAGGVASDGSSIGKGVTDHTHGIGASEPIKDWSPLDFYEKFYVKTSITDVQDVKETIINMYQKLISDLPTVNVLQTCFDAKDSIDGYFVDGANVKTKFKKIPRKPYEAEKYGDLFWIKTYVIMRMSEMGKDSLIDHDNLNKVMSDVNQLYYFVDKSAALIYINNHLKQFY